MRLYMAKDLMIVAIFRIIVCVNMGLALVGVLS